MTLQEKLASDLVQAQKKGDKVRVSVIRMARAALKNAEIARGESLDENSVIDVVAREAKQHRESIAEFSKGGRQDLVDKEKAELAILLEYLPKQLSRDEISAMARDVIDKVGARGPSDKGKVMGQLMPQLKGKADGKEANEIVSELLAG
jgi:uncharacterized protein YqeY